MRGARWLVRRQAQWVGKGRADMANVASWQHEVSGQIAAAVVQKKPRRKGLAAGLPVVAEICGTSAGG